MKTRIWGASFKLVGFPAIISITCLSSIRTEINWFGVFFSSVSVLMFDFFTGSISDFAPPLNSLSFMNVRYFSSTNSKLSVALVA